MPILNTRKAVSPLVATILLVVITIAIAVIIFMWQAGFFAEQISKFNAPAERACEKIVFDWSYSSGTLSIENQGNVPISRINVKLIKAEGSSKTADVAAVSVKPAETSISKPGLSILGAIEAGDELEVIPYITGIGVKTSTSKLYLCKNAGLKKTITQ